MTDDAITVANREKAQHELIFLQLVSVFVGAIRCSVLDVEQAREPLSHYGRFGPTYDAIVKKLVDPLRDEGIYNKESTTVQHIAASALSSVSYSVLWFCLAHKQCFDLFLDTGDDEPTATIALAKLLASAFIVQGNHFVVLRQLHPDDVHDFHLVCIDTVSRKITSAVRSLKSAKAKSAKDHASQRVAQTLTFFKALVHLLGPVTGQDAVKIRDHLEETIQGTGASITSNRQWDGYRMYEKRLMSIASKDPNVRVVMQAAAGKRKVVRAEEDADDAATEGSDEEGDVVEAEEVVPAKRTATRANIGQDDENSDDQDDTEEQQEGEDEEEAEAESAPQDADADEAEGDEGEEGDLDIDEAFDDLEKRKRAEDDDGQVNGNEDGKGLDLDLDLDPDLELDLDLPNTQERAARERSASVDMPPVNKKRRTAKRY